MPTTKHSEASHKSRSREYVSWCAMKGRCNNPSDPSYDRYGGKGITVCDRWNGSYENFLADMGRRPSLRHSLDRIDNAGNYEPKNCRWATQSQQNFNQTKQPLCVRGHSLSEAKVYKDKSGYLHRMCRPCHQINKKLQRQRAGE